MSKKKESSEKNLKEKSLSEEKDLSNEKKVSKKKVEDDEPSWYHYVIVLLVIFGVFGVLYFVFEVYDSNSKVSGKDDLDDFAKTYNYPYKVGNVTYNIKFDYPVDEIVQGEVLIEPTKLDLLNTVRMHMVFYEYNGTDNGKVTVAATKFYSFFSNVYHMGFGENMMINESSCENSSLKDKVVVFDIYSDRTGVFYDENNGCVRVESEKVEDFVLVLDSLLYSLVKE